MGPRRAREPPGSSRTGRHPADRPRTRRRCCGEQSDVDHRAAREGNDSVAQTMPSGPSGTVARTRFRGGRRMTGQYALRRPGRAWLASRTGVRVRTRSWVPACWGRVPIDTACSLCRGVRLSSNPRSWNGSIRSPRRNNRVSDSISTVLSRTGRSSASRTRSNSTADSVSCVSPGIAADTCHVLDRAGAGDRVVDGLHEDETERTP